MINSRREIAEDALYKATQVRTDNGLDSRQPICIYELCHQLGIEVRFVDISMEGMYVGGKKPKILLSALRPLPRRNFTCAHELGHHIYKHGSSIDALTENHQEFKDPKEQLVDSFAGFLLMPKLGVLKAFNLRKWNPEKATSAQFFTIACSFGVGYETLIDHMTYALKIINYSKATSLRKSTPKTIREVLLGYASTDPLVIADEHWSLSTIDVEAGTQLLLPKNVEIENSAISFQREHQLGRIFRANHSGLIRVCSQDKAWAVLVRISPYQWCGLSRYRHFPEVVEDEE